MSVQQQLIDIDAKLAELTAQKERLTSIAEEEEAKAAGQMSLFDMT